MIRRALITGAGRGIGRAIALEFAKQGYAVAITDVDFDSYRQFPNDSEHNSILDELEKNRVPFLAKTIRHERDITAFAETIHQRWGGLDALICNAGGGTGPLESNHASVLRIDDLAEVINRNLYETVRTVTALVPLLECGNGSSIVTMSSLNGLEPTPDGRYAHYGVAKAAVAHYTRFLARDLEGRRIRANGVAPGVIATGRLEQRMRETLGGNTDLIRQGVGSGTPNDVASTVKFLAGSESSFINGQVIRVDGGY